jgi:hypothetical protein
MVLFECEDFDFWVGNDPFEVRYKQFAPLFVYLLYWAYCENKLSGEFLDDDVLMGDFSELINNGGDFNRFVIKQMKGKMLDSYFCSSVRQFVRDYYECEGFSTDLVKFYKRNLWQLPHSLECGGQFNELINIGMSNYYKNLINEPDIVNFDTPKP